MTARTTLIAVLVVIELAIIGGAVSAIRGDNTPWFSQNASAQPATGGSITEGGTHQVFSVGGRPTLTVDIGYADLTILTGAAGKVDVSVSNSTDFGPMRSTAPISAHQSGDAIRIKKPEDTGWSMGDNRMVTVIVPPETQVSVLSGGDISASGLRAAASFDSVGNGSIAVDDFNGPTLDISSSGRISMHSVITPRLDASSSDGRIQGSALQVRDGHIKSDDGRVTLSFAAGTNTTVDAATDDGTVNVSGFTAATSTSSSKSDDGDASSGTVRIGDGNGRLDVRSSDGNIEIRQDS
jgi:hypothetical protein